MSGLRFFIAALSFLLALVTWYFAIVVYGFPGSGTNPYQQLIPLLSIFIFAELVFAIAIITSEWKVDAVRLVVMLLCGAFIPINVYAIHFGYNLLEYTAGGLWMWLTLLSVPFLIVRTFKKRSAIGELLTVGLLIGLGFGASIDFVVWIGGM